MSARDDFPLTPRLRYDPHGQTWQAMCDEIDRLRGELDAERTVRKQLAASRDAMVATVSFLASVIRCGEPMTPEVKQAIENYYTRWDTLLAASDALDKDGE